MLRRFLPTGLAIALAATCWGCGGGSDRSKEKRPAVVPAEGTVTYKGQPVDGATVVLAPAEKGYAAAAITDGAGRFVLAAFPPDPGAVPGSYKVTITKVSMPPQQQLPEGAHADDFPPPPPPKSLIPDKYKDADKSTLTVDIPPAGKTDLAFDLTD